MDKTGNAAEPQQDGWYQPEVIGLRLNDSSLIIPRKSVGMVMGVGRDIPQLHGRTHCDFCSLKTTCHMNNVVAAVK